MLLRLFTKRYLNPGGLGHHHKLEVNFSRILMSRDEVVDGAKIAAQIMSRMKKENREKILVAMQARHPEIAKQVESKLFDFNTILEVAPQGIQTLVKEVPHNDLVVSMKTATVEVKELVLSNMSDRKRQQVEEDFAALPPTRISEVERAQRNVLEKLDELLTAGKIRTQSKNDIWV